MDAGHIQHKKTLFVMIQSIVLKKNIHMAINRDLLKFVPDWPLTSPVALYKFIDKNEVLFPS